MNSITTYLRGYYAMMSLTDMIHHKTLLSAYCLNHQLDFIDVGKCYKLHSNAKNFNLRKFYTDDPLTHLSNYV